MSLQDVRPSYRSVDSVGIKSLIFAKPTSYSQFHHERSSKFGPDRWYRPCNLRPAAPAPAPRTRPDPGRTGGAGGSCPLRPVLAGERPAGAEAVADRAAGVGA